MKEVEYTCYFDLAEIVDSMDVSGQWDLVTYLLSNIEDADPDKYKREMKMLCEDYIDSESVEEVLGSIFDERNNHTYIPSLVKVLRDIVKESPALLEVLRENLAYCFGDGWFSKK